VTTRVKTTRPHHFVADILSEEGGIFPFLFSGIIHGQFEDLDCRLRLGKDVHQVRDEITRLPSRGEAGVMVFEDDRLDR